MGETGGLAARAAVLFSRRQNRTSLPGVPEFMATYDGVRKLRLGHDRNLGKGIVVKHPAAGLYDVRADGELVATHTQPGSAALQAHQILEERRLGPPVRALPRRLEAGPRQSGPSRVRR